MQQIPLISFLRLSSPCAKLNIEPTKTYFFSLQCTVPTCVKVVLNFLSNFLKYYGDNYLNSTIIILGFSLFTNAHLLVVV